MNYEDKYDVEGIVNDFNEGVSYRKMSAKWGLSVNTLRAIIKDIGMKEVTDVKKVVEKLYDLCISKEGILESDESSIIIDVVGKWDAQIKKKARRACRERAKKEGKECLFIPDWMGRQAARANRDFMFSLATELNERLNEYVMEYCRQTGYSGQDVMFVLCQLAIPKYSPASITEICARYEKIVEQIENV